MERNLWKETVLDQIQKSQLGILIEPLQRVYDEKDVELLSLVQRKFLLQPSKANEDQNYNLVNPDPKFDTSMGQAKAVREILNDKVSISKV